MAKAGANAVKLQTFTAETMTIKSGKAAFQLPSDTLWAGTDLYSLYEKAATPWEWHDKLQKVRDGKLRSAGWLVGEGLALVFMHGGSMA